MLFLRKVLLVSTILACSFFVFTGQASLKSEIPANLEDRRLAGTNTYAALFSSANGLLGTDIDIDRMSEILNEMGAASVISDKTATIGDLAKITALQSQRASENKGNLFLFFSGHGMPYNLILEHNENFSLLHWLRYVDASASGDIDVTVFLDTCYAGSIVDVASKGEFKHIRNIVIAASSQADASSPDYGDVFGGAFTGSFYLAYKTYRLRHPFGVPVWGDIAYYVYRIYAFVTPRTAPVFSLVPIK